MVLQRLMNVEEDPSKCHCTAHQSRRREAIRAPVKHPLENKNELHDSYRKLPPEVFIYRKMGANVFMDTGELARAQWFWERRPKKLVLSTEAVLKILIFYGGFWLVANYLDQQALETTALVSTGSTLVIAMPLWAYVDALRFARWSSDYRRAILRLRQTVHR